MGIVISIIILACGGIYLLAVLNKGGAFTQVTRNVSYLYYQAKIVYPKMREDAIRYMAILINASSIQDRLSKEDIKRLVLEYSGKDWGDLCQEYTWTYSRLCRGPPIEIISPELIANFNKKIKSEIISVGANVSSGHIKYDAEKTLRSLPQLFTLGIILDMDNAKEIQR